MITVNLEKAKEIAHTRRRAARLEQFQPHDEIISKQIPGTSFAEAEAARASIREKFSVLQEDIDAAETVDDLKEAISKF